MRIKITNDANQVIYEEDFYGLDSVYSYIKNCDELIDIEKILYKSILSINSFLDDRAERLNDN